MQSSTPLLSLAIWLPIAFGALVLATGNDSRAPYVRGLSLLGALVSLLVTVADLSLFNIGAAFWGLMAGFAVSWLLERRDFGALAEKD